MAAVTTTRSPGARLMGKRPPSISGLTCSITTRCARRSVNGGIAGGGVARLFRARGARMRRVGSLVVSLIRIDPSGPWRVRDGTAVECTGWLRGRQECADLLYLSRMPCSRPMPFLALAFVGVLATYSGVLIFYIRTQESAN